MNWLEAHLTAWLKRETVLIEHPHALLVLFVILLVGFVFARLARKFKLPQITGQIIGGVLLGHFALNVFDESAYESFTPITNFALGFIGFTIGSHLDFRKLHNAGRRIAFIALIDLLLTPTLVFVALRQLVNLDFRISLLAAAISATTAPGSMIHIMREKRAKGMFSKTVMATVALNNVLVIMLFYAVYYYLFSMGGADETRALVQSFTRPMLLLAEALLVGGTVGFGLIFFTERRLTNISFLTLIILAVVMAVGLSETLHFSGLLSSLFVGVIITNFSSNKNTIFSAFKDIEREVFTLFFVLAGTHLDFKAIGVAGLAGGVLIAARFTGKYVGPTIGAWLGGATSTTRQWIGLAMHPIAGVAIGLVLLCENIPYIKQLTVDMGGGQFLNGPDLITAIMLSVVVVNELAGPLLTGLTIDKTGEADKNRMRLMDFLQEEFITVDLDPADKWDALNQMAAFLHRTHNITELSLGELTQHIINREKEISTGIGENIAIPHAIIEGGPKIRGVIGVCPRGIDFESLDGLPVYIVMLIATPKKHYDMHLHILANIAKIFGNHPHIKERMINAKTPAAVFEILQAQEVEALNPFFEE